MTGEQVPLLSMRGMDKRFAGIPALTGASLDVLPAEVHALIGQNGAGKSTMIKILTGAYAKDAGEVHFDGRPFAVDSPQAAQRHGISTIYQEINLVPYRSVTENIFLGREHRRFGLLDWGRMHREATEVLRRFDVAVDVRRPLMSFNTAIQQMVAIARAVSFEAKLVIMDEPTSSLDEHEVAVLFDVIRQLKREGVAVIFVSHKLDELYAVCDRVTIMRDGRTIATEPMAAVGKVELVARMLGKEVGEVRRSGATGFRQRDAADTGETVATAAHFRRGRVLEDASVSVRAGEIVGLAGLLGSGRTELARALFGADPVEGGQLAVDGKPVSFRSPRDAIRHGFGLCSEDRKADGIIPWMSVRENLTLAALPTLADHGVVRRDEQRAIVDRFIARLGIKTAGPEQRIRELSGGNQQKVLLARWLCLNPRLLLLDEPTRGIDVGAKAEIQGLIDELADRGLGVLMISSELEEITEGSDRVVVMREGRTVAELDRAESTPDRVMHAMAQDATGDADGPAAARG